MVSAHGSSPATRCSTSHAATRVSGSFCSKEASGIAGSTRRRRWSPRASASRRARTDRARRPERVRAADPVAATTIFRAIYYARDRRAFFRHVAAFTEKKLVFDLEPAPVPRGRRASPTCAPPASPRSLCARSSVHPDSRLPGPVVGLAKALGALGTTSRDSRFELASRTWSRPRARSKMRLKMHVEARRRGHGGRSSTGRGGAFGENVGGDRDLDAPRAVRCAEEGRGSPRESGTRNVPLPVTRPIAGCLSGPIVTGPIRAAAIRRSGGSRGRGHQPRGRA